MAIVFPAEVIAGDKSSRSFGAYIKELKDLRGVKVTHLVADAGLSRANYYLLENDKQRPSLSTAIAVLNALGAETRVPAPDDPDLTKDLDVQDGETLLALRINWSVSDRRRSREKFWTAAGVGLGAAAGVGFASSAGAGLAGLGLGGLGLGAAALIPGGVPIAGVAIAAKLLRDRSKAKIKTKGPHAEKLDADVFADFSKTAEDMSTEELEALLEAMKAMRAEREGEESA
jgi:transcriptional regulator with XRE-family HTH domain